MRYGKKIKLRGHVLPFRSKQAKVVNIKKKCNNSIQGVIEMRDQILTRSYWLHLGTRKKYF
jgi:hypothetical protein